MRNQGSLIRLAPLACLLALLSPRSGWGEGFTVTQVHYDQGWDLYGLESTGALVVYDTSTMQYQTYVNGSMTGASSIAPSASLLDDGSACTPSTPSGFSLAGARCNGSLAAIDGWNYGENPGQHAPVLYSDAVASSDQVAVGGGGALFLNAAGEMAWDDVYSDTIYQAVPLAVAATPEPSSLLLLATGTSALVGLAKRRRSLQ